jgi:hypothetical protein
MADPEGTTGKAPSARAENEPKSTTLPVEVLGGKLFLAVPVIAVIAAAVTGVLYDVGMAILVLAGVALLAVISILWASLRTLSGDAPITIEEAIAVGALPATEAQKRAVLQAIKDLDYERSIGKVDDGDYKELMGRYRAEAKKLLRAMDDDLEPARARAVRYLAKALEGRAPIKPKEEAPSDAAALEAADAPAAKAKTAAPRSSCPACSTDNEPDALFCKRCGAKMRAAVTEKADVNA